MPHSLLDLLRNAVVEYGYWALAGTLLLENAGVPVPGETILLLASFLAYSEKQLQLSWIILVATTAATLGDNLGFALGYYGGRRLQVHYQRIFRISDATLKRGEDLFNKYGPATVFFSRFVFGMRIITGPLAGVLRMPWPRFLVFNFLGAILWVTVISSIGYLFGRHWQKMERGVERFDIVVLLIVVLLALLLWRRNRKLSRSASAK